MYLYRPTQRSWGEPEQATGIGGPLYYVTNRQLVASCQAPCCYRGTRVSSHLSQVVTLYSAASRGLLVATVELVLAVSHLSQVITLYICSDVSRESPTTIYLPTHNFTLACKCSLYTVIAAESQWHYYSTVEPPVLAATPLFVYMRWPV